MGIEPPTCDAEGNSKTAAPFGRQSIKVVSSINYKAIVFDTHKKCSVTELPVMVSQSFTTSHPRHMSSISDTLNLSPTIIIYDAGDYRGFAG